MPDCRIGLYPLPWLLAADGFDLTVPVLRLAGSQTSVAYLNEKGLT